MDLDLASAAYHEAGHVVLAQLLGGDVVETALDSDRDVHRGHTAVTWHGLDESERLRRSALVALAELRDPAVWERRCRVADALETHGTLDRSLLEDLLG